MPVASARPDQNPREVASQSGPEGPWPTGARWRVDKQRWVSLSPRGAMTASGCTGLGRKKRKTHGCGDRPGLVHPKRRTRHSRRARADQDRGEGGGVTRKRTEGPFHPSKTCIEPHSSVVPAGWARPISCGGWGALPNCRSKWARYRRGGGEGKGEQGKRKTWGVGWPEATGADSTDFFG